MGFQIIQDRLNEKVNKKQFLKECGIFLVLVVVAPVLLEKFINKPRFKIIGNRMFLDDELIIERRDDGKN